MTEQWTVHDRIRRLDADLGQASVGYLKRGRSNYFSAYILLIATIISSAAVGVVGLILPLQKDTVALLALLPGFFSIVAVTLKLQDRANWHYRKKDSLEALRRTLLYELPERPSAKDVEAVAQSWTALDSAMTKEWEGTLRLDFSVPASGGVAEARKDSKPRASARR